MSVAGLREQRKGEADGQPSGRPRWPGAMHTVCAALTPLSHARGHDERSAMGHPARPGVQTVFRRERAGGGGERSVFTGQTALVERQAEIFLPQLCNPAPGPKGFSGWGGRATLSTCGTCLPAQ